MTTESGPVPARVVSPAPTPESYIVDTGLGKLRRNRSQMRVVPNSPEMDGEDRGEDSFQDASALTDAPEQPPLQIMTRSQTGVQLKFPDRLA